MHSGKRVGPANRSLPCMCCSLAIALERRLLHLPSGQRRAEDEYPYNFQTDVDGHDNNNAGQGEGCVRGRCGGFAEPAVWSSMAMVPVGSS